VGAIRRLCAAGIVFSKASSKALSSKASSQGAGAIRRLASAGIELVVKLLVVKPVVKVWALSGAWLRQVLMQHT
jgi:hypothetical protein